MIVIGLHGKIGAGKSTVARMFADLGATVIDADVLAHAVLGEPDARDEIVARFGDGVLDAAGSVSRAALAEHVFGPNPDQAAALRDLEAIVHPRVRRHIGARLHASHGEEEAGGVQSGWAEACDVVVAVECEEPVRRRRLAARGLATEQVAAREKSWEAGVAGRPLAGGKVRAVDASGEAAYTRRQVDRIWAGLPD